MAFLNTDNLSFANETVNGNSFHNEGESKIIKLVSEITERERKITITIYVIYLSMLSNVLSILLHLLFYTIASTI